MSIKDPEGVDRHGYDERDNFSRSLLTCFQYTSSSSLQNHDSPKDHESMVCTTQVLH